MRSSHAHNPKDGEPPVSYAIAGDPRNLLDAHRNTVRRIAVGRSNGSRKVGQRLGDTCHTRPRCYVVDRTRR